MADGQGWEGAIHGTYVCDLSILVDWVKWVAKNDDKEWKIWKQSGYNKRDHNHCNIENKVAGSKEICQVVTGYASRHLHLVHIAVGIFVAIAQHKQVHDCPL